MKKFLLIIAFISILDAQAQDYWTEFATAQSAASTGMSSLSIVDATTTWASMACGTSGCTPIRRFSRTLNNGSSWNTAVVDLGPNSANLRIANISATSSSTAYVSVFPGASGAVGGIWKTVDGGVTWARQTTATFTGTDAFCDLVHFFNANDGVALGDPNDGFYEIYTTSNGGTNWTRVASTPELIPTPGGEDYGLTNQFTATGNTIWVGTSYGKILKSTDKGLTWTLTQTPIPDFGSGLHGTESGDLAFIDSNNGLLQTSDYILYNTTDGGATWNNVAWNGQLRNFGLSEIPGTANSYVSIGEDSIDVIRGSSFSTDGGLNWTDINNAPDANMVDGGIITFLSPSVGFASGFSTTAAVGGVFRWNNVSLAASSFSDDKLFAATPNPTTGILDISGENINNIAVYDILGKLLINKSFSSIATTSLDLTALNAGLYIVKVTNDSSISSSIKVIKE